MFGVFGARQLMAKREAAKNPRKGFCDCPPSNGLDHNKIAAALGSSKVVCMKCNRRLRLKAKAK